jgi:hypothetical protein
VVVVVVVASWRHRSGVVMVLHTDLKRHHHREQS